MNWTFFHRLGSPRWFFEISGRWLPVLAVAATVTLLTGLIWGLAFAPADYLQGNSYRIIFIHVPSAFLAQSIYIMMALAAVVQLVWHIKLADMALASLTPIGTSMTLLALVTGAIWGKPTWGTWWVWDARLTSMLILLFLYLGVLALRGGLKASVAPRACALLTLVGVVNIPIIKFSVQWWNTLHQGATLTLTRKPAMALDMLLPLLVAIAGFYLFFALVFLLRMRLVILEREKRTHWVRQL